MSVAQLRVEYRFDIKHRLDQERWLMRYLIAYDIAAPDRLRRVARILERNAVRIQKSVFIAEITASALNDLMKTVSGVMDLQEDVVQAFRLAINQPMNGEFVGSVVPLAPAVVICGTGDLQFVGGRL